MTEDDQQSPTTYRLTIDQSVTAVDALAELTHLPKARIKDAMFKGAVWLKPAASPGKPSRLRRATRTLSPGDELSLHYHPEVLAQHAPLPGLIKDCAQYSVWYKPAGLMSSGSRFSDHHSIVRCVQTKLDRTSLLVHRLDRFTRGIMVIAHAKGTARQLATQFRERGVRKDYQARVHGELTQPQTIEARLDDKSAVTHVEPVESNESTTCVAVRIDTGRKHQIRRHLAEIGHPVVGDVQYGNDQYGDLQLVSVGLAFECPDLGVPVQFRLEQDLCLF